MEIFTIRKRNTTQSNRKVGHVRLYPPKSTFSEDHTSAPMGCCPLKFAHALEIDQSLLRHNPPGFSNHSCCLSYARSLVVHISARLWLNAHKTLVYIHISQGSVASGLRCCRYFKKFYRKLSAECACQRVIKLGQYLAKMWTKVWWHVFYGPRCRIDPLRVEIAIFQYHAIVDRNSDIDIAED